MSKVSVISTVRAPAEKVWGLVGDFGALAKWHPAVAESVIEKRGGETVRRLTLAGGGTIVERLDEHDDAAMRLAYSILEGPLPVADYVAQLQVRGAAAPNCTIEWSAEFVPSGATASEAEQVIRGIFEAGLDNLGRKFGG